MIRVLVVDDHAVVREGLVRIISGSDDMLVAGEASSGSEALQMIGRQQWDVMLLDVSMPGVSGLEVLKRLQRTGTSLPTIVLSLYDEDQYGIRALRSGAAGYLTKRVASQELLRAIRKVASGKPYISEALAERLASQVNEDVLKMPHERLSDREFEILCLYASGWTATRIAESLCLSVQTVSTHRRRILHKIGMQTNAEMMHYAISNRLISPAA